MQIPNINRYLSSIYKEPVIEVFKHFNSHGVWSVVAGFWCFGIS